MDDVEVDSVGCSERVFPVGLSNDLLAQIDARYQRVQGENKGIETGLLARLLRSGILVVLQIDFLQSPRDSVLLSMSNGQV